MKRIISLLLALVLCLSLCACGGEKSADKEGGSENSEPTGSEGLEFCTYSDGTCQVTGLGACTDTEIVIPAKYGDFKVIAICHDAFEDCGSITGVIISEGVVEIRSEAFQDCGKLKSVTIPNSVTRIWVGTFEGCHSLKSIYYGGTMSQWQAINKEEGWDSGRYGYTVYCTDGKITK